jgi:toxin CcdB
MEPPTLAADPARILKIPVASLSEHQYSITAALDFLFHGF